MPASPCELREQCTRPCFRVRPLCAPACAFSLAHTFFILLVASCLGFPSSACVRLYREGPVLHSIAAYTFRTPVPCMLYAKEYFTIWHVIYRIWVREPCTSEAWRSRAHFGVRRCVTRFALARHRTRGPRVRQELSEDMM